MDEETEDIRRRVSLRALVSTRVALQRRGQRFVGLCPFHREKTPSFHVVEDKGFYHCFGCGEKGDVFTWLQKTQGLTFPQALQRLAQQAGIALKRKPETAKGREKRQQLERIRETLACAEDFYRKALFASEGAQARRYLQKRGIDKACAQRFALGWADEDTRPFFEHMNKNDRSEKDLGEAGLVLDRQSRENTRMRARFRSRILFPIADNQGRTIAFGGRFLPTENETKNNFSPPKYLNSPETSLFSKGRHLYNFARARQKSRPVSSAQATPVVLVEGYTDVLALDKAGFPTSLASLGTALSETQLLLLWQCSDSPVLCFDGDAAGTMAAKRAVLRALPLLDATRNLNIFFLPEGQDPDSFVKTFGVEKWRQALQKTETVSAFLWRSEKDRLAPQKTPEQLARLENTLMGYVESVKASLLAKHYRAFFKDALFLERRRQNERQKAVCNALPFSNDEPQRLRRLQERLLATLASRPQLWDAYEERFARTALPHDLDAARQAMLLAYAEAPEDADLTQLLWQSAGEVLKNIVQDPKFFAQNPYLQAQAPIERVRESVEKIFLALEYFAIRQDLKQDDKEASQQKSQLYREASRIFHEKMQAEH